ncbi:fatty acid desaturase family protein [Roseobacter sp. YSTF-M11]|uniref:Fatty acid desaturase family protein n=1 Tax=Roseobacter insulae TaxID=2859783 RepID=A0A9X1FTY5_9RHOB|nr:fatty acid desaturase family protein [Roseobacter insulae]MBW4707810.1 fatty acid desaturase family protein [Roseobacter insulae]
MDILLYALQFFLIYLAADLLGGVFHWAEDTLGDENTPLWGRHVVASNVIHHNDPTAMNRIHWLKNNASSFGASALVILGAYAGAVLTWQLCAFAILAGLNQQVHRFAHAPRLSLPSWVIALQRWGVLQDAAHHWRHHKAPHTTHYCVMSPMLNPVLDKIGFWRLAERLLVPICGAPRRDDLRGEPWYHPAELRRGPGCG